VFSGQGSSTTSISASIIQGPGIGPAAYTVTAADLKVLQSGNYSEVRISSSHQQRRHVPAGDGQHTDMGGIEQP